MDISLFPANPASHVQHCDLGKPILCTGQADKADPCSPLVRPCRGILLMFVDLLVVFWARRHAESFPELVGLIVTSSRPKPSHLDSTLSGAKKHNTISRSGFTINLLLVKRCEVDGLVHSTISGF